MSTVGVAANPPCAVTYNASSIVDTYILSLVIYLGNFLKPLMAKKVWIF
jgi:hypothetical protein